MPSPWAQTLLIALLCLIWGSTWFVITVGLKDIPPFHGAGFRMVIAALAMTGVAARLRRREGGSSPPLWLSLMMGTCNIGLSYGIIYWAEGDGGLPSGLVSALWAVFPLMVAVAGHLLLPGERLRGIQGLGFVVGFLGIWVLFERDIQDLGPHAIRNGLILLLSPLVSTVGTVLVKRHGRDVSSLVLNRNGMAIGAVMLMGAAFVLEEEAEIRWTAPAIASLAYLSLVGTVLAFGLYYWLMRYVPATRLSLITYVTPLVALYLGWRFNAEEVGSETLLGAGLILGGVALARWRRG